MIPYNKPYYTGNELAYIQQAMESGHLSGDGMFTKKCHAWLEDQIGCKKALLSHSCTAALEMAAILAGIQPGDEVIMPSYTFVSTANAFVLFGAKPVFVDIRPDTLNIDETRIEAAITSRTKAIVVVHYAGVACEMDPIMEIASKHNLLVIEDAAQGILAQYKGRPLGSIGHLAALSFHETKNVISGEGGALLINDPRFIQRAEIIREKGTNRSQFFRGEADKYTWIDVGSSYLPSELTAAFLWAQLEQAGQTVSRRRDIWKAYDQFFEEWERKGMIRRPVVPEHCEHNGHIYYLLLPDRGMRDLFLSGMKRQGIGAIFHYVPLDTSPMGRRFSAGNSPLYRTEELSSRLVRLPLWNGMQEEWRVVAGAAERELARLMPMAVAK